MLHREVIAPPPKRSRIDVAALATSVVVAALCSVMAMAALARSAPPPVANVDAPPPVDDGFVYAETSAVLGSSMPTAAPRTPHPWAADDYDRWLDVPLGSELHARANDGWSVGDESFKAFAWTVAVDPGVSPAEVSTRISCPYDREGGAEAWEAGCRQSFATGRESWTCDLWRGGCAYAWTFATGDDGKLRMDSRGAMHPFWP